MRWARAPNGRRIGAEAAGVKVDERGFIAVDRQMRTNVPHIFAIGDIVGQPMLAHKATHEGKVAAEAAAGLKTHFDASVIPSVAYTDPEIAWVGLTETDAKARGVAFEKAVFPWAASGRSLAIGRDEGFTKLLFDPESHRVHRRRDRRHECRRPDRRGRARDRDGCGRRGHRSHDPSASDALRDGRDGGRGVRGNADGPVPSAQEAAQGDVTRAADR